MMIGFDKIDISYRDYEDFIVIYNFRTKEIVRLEDVAADVWRVISEKDETDIDSIAKRISEIYDCEPSQVYSDMHDFIAELYHNGLVKVDGVYSQEKSKGTEQIAKKNDVDYEGKLIQEMQERDKLYSVTFEMTYSCNERCIHCYANYPEESDTAKVISVSKYKEILDELYEMNCLHVAFTGGDPFMYKGFMEVFSYARSKGFVCDIYTNAQYLSDHDDVMDSILKQRPRAFYISLYGSTSKVHDGVTAVQGSFEKTIKTINKLKENNIPVVLNIMLLSVNSDDAEATINYAKSLGVEYRVGMSIIYKNNGDSSPMNYFINDKEIIKHIMKIGCENIYSIDVPLDELKQGDRICGAGCTALSFSPDGDIYPCISLKVRLGNVFKDSIKTVWDSNKRHNLRNALIWRNTVECMECKSQNECPHCVGISQQESGNMFACNTCDRLISECLYEIKHSKENG